MHIKTLTIAAMLAAGLVAAPAAAEAAQATVSLNVRSGPSTSYGVVDTLYPGEQVDVRSCASNGWCQISHSGPDGWVSGSYLTNTGGSVAPPPPRVGVGVNTPGFSFWFGNGPRYDRDHRRPRRGSVCFFQRRNYDGPSFCARPGDRDARLTGSWNNRISSIRIRGNAEVVLCRKRNFRNCTVYSHSQPRLRGNNNIVSSYRIR